jgi:hypothetical protein
MSNYDRFHAFKRIYEARLGHDIVRVIRGEVELTRADFLEKLESLDDAKFAFERFSDAKILRLQNTLAEQRFEWGLVARAVDEGWGPAVRVHQEYQYNQKRKMVYAALQALEDARAEEKAEFKRLKNSVKAVKAEYRDFFATALQ